MTENQRKMVLVTGGSSGIGLSIAGQLSDQFHVHSLDIKPSPIAGKVNQHVCDLRVRDDVRETISKICSNGSLHSVILCAGIHQSSYESDYDSFSEIIDTNLKDTFFLITQTLPYLLASKLKFRHIVVISSASSAKGIATNPGYAASKAGLDSLVRSLSQRYAQQGLIINSLNPGWVQTKMLEESIEKYKSITGKSREEIVSIFQGQSIAKKFIEPTEISELVNFMISDKAPSLLGQNVFIDNGYSIM